MTACADRFLRADDVHIAVSSLREKKLGAIVPQDLRGRSFQAVTSAAIQSRHSQAATGYAGSST